MLSNKKYGILYLDRNGFTYYNHNNTPISFTYPASSIKELDVINEQLLIDETEQFILSNKISPVILMIVLSSEFLYEKEFIYESVEIVKKPESIKNLSGVTDIQTDSAKMDLPIPVTAPKTPEELKEDQLRLEEERKRQIQLFLEIVPFEEIASKTYKIDKGVKVIATNKKLYETFIHACAKLSFLIDSVIPITLLPKHINEGSVMNQEVAKKIFKKFESLRVFSMLEENSYPLSRAALTPHGITMSTKVTSRRELMLIGVFVLLIGVLGIFAYTMVIAPNDKTKVASIIEKPTVIVTSPTLTLIPSPEASRSGVINKSSINILLTGGSVTQLNLLKNTLIQNGYESINLRPDNSTTSGRALVIFTSIVSIDEQQQMLEVLRKNLLSVTAQEAATAEAEVIINL